MTSRGQTFSLSLRLALMSLLLIFLATPNLAQTDNSNPNSASPPKEQDPDLPEFMRGKINDANYLRMREQFILQLRGIEPGKPFDPFARSRAIQMMQLQQAIIANTAVQAASTTGPAWSAVGPAPIPNGQTAGITDAVSGRVTALAVDPTNSAIVYVGTAQGGVYRSTNGGTNWTPIFDKAHSLAIGALAIAPSSPTTLYVGTGEANFSCDSYAGVGLYRIDNASTTATLVGPIDPTGSNAVSGTHSFTGRTISKILVHPTNPAVVFVATASGIMGIGCDLPKGGTVPPLPPRGVYRSTNATASLSLITFHKLTVTTAGSIAPDTTGNRSVLDMVFEPGNPNSMLATVFGTNALHDGGIYRSTNAQATTPTFTQTLILGGSNFGVRAGLAINKVGTTVTVYAASDEPATGGCAGNDGLVRKSTNGGMTWTAPLSGGQGFCGGQCFYDLAIAVDPGSANNVYIGGSAPGSCSNQFQKSVNGGSTFAVADSGLHADTHAILLDPLVPTTVYTGNDGGIWKSLNSGTSWTDLNSKGFSATQFQSLALHPSSRNFTIGGTQDNGTNFRNPAGTWTRIDFGDGGYSLIDQNATDTTNVTMYHTYFNQTNNFIGFARVDSTTSAGDGLWPFFGCGFGTPNGISCSDHVQFYAPMAHGPGNPNTIYFGTDRLYRSPDKGLTMTVVSEAPLSSVANVSTIGISRQNDNVRIVGLTNGQVFATSTGSSVLRNVTGTLPAKYVGRVVIDPNNGNTAYVALGGFMGNTTSHVWKTTNLNVTSPTWTAAGSGIPDVPVNAFVVDPKNSSNLFAGTDIGVYNSVNGGLSWVPFGTNFPVVAVFDMAIQNANRVLRAATHGRGIFEVSLRRSDMQITKTAPTSVAQSTDLTYTIVAKNNGPDAAGSVLITDTVPSGATFKSATVTSPASCTTPAVGATGTVSCSQATLANAASINLTLVVHVTAASGATVTNTASVKSANFDPNFLNNSSKVSTSVTP
jgi:uncharacterized repeat protein (TIGR01451 family)